MGDYGAHMTAKNSKDLIERIDAFLKLSGWTPTEFGREAMNDPSFVSRLKNGRKIGLDTAAGLDKFINEQLANLPNLPKKKTDEGTHQAA